MAEAAKVFGKGLSLTHKGKTYTLAPLTLDMLAMFEVWLEDRAFAKVERSRGRVSEDAYRERLDAVARLVASESFSHVGRLAFEASRSREGQIYLLFLQLSKNDNEVDEVLAEEIWEAHRDEVLAKQRAAMGTVPNPQTPTTQAA